MFIIGGLILIFVIWFAFKTLAFIIKMSLSLVVFGLALALIFGVGFF
ncbi:MAG: hypothetical protein LBN21_07030 [Treponema sp.]|nr:hypothetical protein [Treponema sp.]